MWVTEFGMVKFIKEPQPEKALYPMKITESRMVKLVKELQSSKASSLPVLLA